VSRLTRSIQHALENVPRPAARWSRVFGLGIIVGIFGGLAAFILDAGLKWGTHNIIEHYAHMSGDAITFDFNIWLLILPTCGCLLSGILIRLFCPASFGKHGTDSLTHAFHRGMGHFPFRGPAVRGAAAVGVISTGGSAGPEGPIAALGAAIGSTVGRFFQVTPQERRVLLVAGCAAGVGAIFRCPLGGALFATSLMYSDEEFESDAMVPSFVASVIGFTTFATLKAEGLGQLGTFLDVAGADQLAFNAALELIPYALLGPLCGIVAIFFSWCLQIIEKRVVPNLRLPRWAIPALGGLLTGLLACVLPQIMDGHYQFILNAMRGFGDIAQHTRTDWLNYAALFGAVALIKCVATAFTVGSGSAGGVLGPSVFIGGALGAFLGALIEAMFPGTFPPQLREALIPVGMGGVLAAAMRTPLAAIVMVTEMTGGYGLIVPLMLVCMTSYVVGRRWGLNHEQVRTSAESPAHAGDAIVHLLESWRVRDLMEPAWDDTVSPETSLPEMVERIKPGTRPVFAVAQDGHLMGVVSVPDIRRFMEEPGLASFVIAADMMTTDLEIIDADTEVYLALDVFRRGSHSVVPVIERRHDNAWVGMLSRERVFEAIREGLAESQAAMFKEHVGLTAIEQEGQLQNLVMGVAPTRKDMIQRLIVPMDAIGKSLREADFRAKYSAQVIAIEQPDGSVQCPPDLDSPLKTGQRLMAVVWQGEVSDAGK